MWLWFQKLRNLEKEEIISACEGKGKEGFKEVLGIWIASTGIGRRS